MQGGGANAALIAKMQAEIDALKAAQSAPKAVESKELEDDKEALIVRYTELATALGMKDVDGNRRWRASTYKAKIEEMEAKLEEQEADKEFENENE